jgi:hypothetical protein
MKMVIVAGLIAMALITSAAGCMSRMHGRMAGMMGSQASGERSDSASDSMMSMGQKGMGPGMMDCCNEQCPMMKGNGVKPQPS